MNSEDLDAMRAAVLLGGWRHAIKMGTEHWSVIVSEGLEFASDLSEFLGVIGARAFQRSAFSSNTDQDPVPPTPGGIALLVFRVLPVQSCWVLQEPSLNQMAIFLEEPGARSFDFEKLYLRQRLPVHLSGVSLFWFRRYGRSAGVHLVEERIRA